MHTRCIQWILAAVDTQEAGTLLERFGPQSRHVLQRLARFECTVRVAMLHDVLREAWTNARHTRQERGRRRVDVDADSVDAVLDHGIERARQMAFAEVMLILANADRLGLDLHELGERILQATRN